MDDVTIRFEITIHDTQTEFIDDHYEQLEELAIKTLHDTIQQHSELFKFKNDVLRFINQEGKYK